MKSNSYVRFTFGLMASLGLACGALVPQDPDAKKIATEQHEAAVRVWADLERAYGETAADIETRALWSRRLAEAAAESGALSAREAFAQHLTRMEKMTKDQEVLYEAGRSNAASVAVGQFHVAEAKKLARR